ncbi:MAG: DMT family transporter [Actinomycetota bacterium]|nr:DMT family transporter [Actinomycetota bacterium]
MAKRSLPVAQALFVTFLWSTSWVLIKIGLEDVPALTFAGLRYAAAFLVLAPLVLIRPSLRSRLSAGDWLRLGVLGLLLYTVTQGAQFLGLAYLPDVNTVSLLLSFSPVMVALMGIPLLGEGPSARQWAGIAIYLAGAATYLYPASFPATQALGLGVVLVGLVANSGSAILGRSVNRQVRLHPLLVTVVSMGIGAVVLLAAGLATQGLPPLATSTWAIILWLAVVNTAFAFTLWNNTLRQLSAVESSIINNTMLIQIAVLAWVFLGQSLGWREVAGLFLAAAGVLIVQLVGQPGGSLQPRSVSLRLAEPR